MHPISLGTSMISSRLSMVTPVPAWVLFKDYPWRNLFTHPYALSFWRNLPVRTEGAQSKFAGLSCPVSRRAHPGGHVAWELRVQVPGSLFSLGHVVDVGGHLPGHRHPGHPCPCPSWPLGQWSRSGPVFPLAWIASSTRVHRRKREPYLVILPCLCRSPV